MGAYHPINTMKKALLVLFTASLLATGCRTSHTYTFQTVDAPSNVPLADVSVRVSQEFADIFTGRKSAPDQHLTSDQEGLVRVLLNRNLVPRITFEKLGYHPIYGNYNHKRRRLTLSSRIDPIGRDSILRGPLLGVLETNGILRVPMTPVAATEEKDQNISEDGVTPVQE